MSFPRSFIYFMPLFLFLLLLYLDMLGIYVYIADKFFTGLDTTATEISVIESVFRLGEGTAPGAIGTTHKDTMVESFY